MLRRLARTAALVGVLLGPPGSAQAGAPAASASSAAPSSRGAAGAGGAAAGSPGAAGARGALAPSSAAPPAAPASGKAAAEATAQEMWALERERTLLMDQARYEDAIPVLERLVAMFEQARGADHPETVTRVLWLATLERWTGQWAASELLCRRALASAERAGQLAGALRERALRFLLATHREKGDLERALPLAEQLVNEAEASSPASQAMVQALVDLAEVHRAMGAFRRAEPPLLKALSIVEEHGRPAAVSSADLGLDESGTAARSEVWRSQTREGEVAVLGALMRLALDAGDAARAEALGRRRVAAAREMAEGGETASLAYGLHDLGRALAAKGDVAGALAVYAESLRIRESTLGRDHPGVATVLHSEAIVRLARGEAAQAEALSLRALGIVEKGYGREHRRAGDVLSVLGNALLAQGRTAGALAAVDRAAQIRDRDAQVTLAVGSDAQKRALLAAHHKHTDAVVSLAVLRARGDGAAARLALRSLLRSKGRLIDAAASELSALRGRLSGDDQALLDELERVTAAIAATAARGEEAAATREGRDRLARLEEARRRLSAAVAERSAAYRAEQEPVSVEAIAAAMPAGAALVEVALFRPFLVPDAGSAPRPGAAAVPWGDARYAAFVLRGGEVSAVDLGPAREVDAPVERLRAALADPDLSRDPRPAGRDLFRRVLAPLAPLVGDARHLLWSPDGALQLVPLAALAGEDGRYVVQERLVTYLGSGRDLLRFEAHAAPRQGPLLIAAPDFGALPGAGAPGRAQGGAKGGGAGRGDAGAPGTAGEGTRAAAGIDMGRIGFPPLPGTAREAGAIHRTLGTGAMLTGELATESAVKRASAPGVLHIATHGFFLPAGEVVAVGDGLEVTAAETAAALARESPLVRSGIALAGANLRASGPDDGILTALEASMLDLSGTELVVLSACETGLGAAVPGDGVHGLRRAFAIAGAETLVMSLWQVDSGRTRELMTAYYEALRRGRGRSEALRDVQLAMLARPATAHPNVWASFIVSGAWAPLRSASFAAPPEVPPGPRGCACAVIGEGRAGSRGGGAGSGLVVLAAAVGVAARSARRRRARA